MALEDLREQAEEPEQPQLDPVILKIRTQMAKLDRVDEIVDAVNFMRVRMGDNASVWDRRRISAS